MRSVTVASFALAAALIVACGTPAKKKRHNNDDDGIGGATVGSSVSSVGGGATVSSSSATTGPSTCDDLGSCGDNQSGCIGCALEGSCAGPLNNCVNNQDCIDFESCAIECADQTCIDNCAASYPSGAQLYDALVSCVYCQECFVSCDGASVGCGG